MRREFLIELNANPIWQEIVRDIKKEISVPKFNPGDPKRDSESQADRWRYMSGRAFENDRICQLLNIEV